MAVRKKKATKKSQVVVYAGRKRKRSTRRKPIARKRRRRLSGNGKASVQDMVMKAGAGTGAAIIASMLAGKVPVKDARVKAAAVAGSGLLFGLSKAGRGKFSQQIALSLVQLGMVSFLKTQFPKVPFLAADDEDIDFDSMLGAPIDAPMLGEAVEYDDEGEILGAPIDVMGQDDTLEDMEEKYDDLLEDTFEDVY